MAIDSGKIQELQEESQADVSRLQELTGLSQSLLDLILSIITKGFSLAGLLRAFQRVSSHSSARALSQIRQEIQGEVSGKWSVTEEELDDALENLVRTAIVVPQTRGVPLLPAGFERFYENLVISLLTNQESFYYLLSLTAQRIYNLLALLSLDVRGEGKTNLLSKIEEEVDNLVECTYSELTNPLPLAQIKEDLDGILVSPASGNIASLSANVDSAIDQLSTIENSFHGVYTRLNLYLRVYESVWKDYFYHMQGFASFFNGLEESGFLARAAASIAQRFSAYMTKLGQDVENRRYLNACRVYLNLLASGKKVLSKFDFSSRPDGSIIAQGRGHISGDEITFTSLVDSPVFDLRDVISLDTDKFVGFLGIGQNTEGFTNGSYKVTQVLENKLVLDTDTGLELDGTFYVYEGGIKYFGHYYALSQNYPALALGGSEGIYYYFSVLAGQKINALRGAGSVSGDLYQEIKSMISSHRQTLSSFAQEVSTFKVPVDQTINQVFEFLEANGLDRGKGLLLSGHLKDFLASDWLGVGSLLELIPSLVKSQ